MTSAEPCILVATDVATDAELVRELLEGEFERVHVSTVAERAVADFEKHRPGVLVLAFNELEKAERYYLGLYRLSKAVHAMPHRTVILCSKDDVRRAYELCRKEYFDDYILFWPMTHDAPRLAMSVRQALRQLTAAQAQQSTPAEFAAQARRIAELEAQLAQYAARGEKQVDTASRTLQRAGQEIGAALDGFSARLTGGALREVVEIRDRQRFEDEVARLRAERIEPKLRSAVEAVAPVKQWLGTLRHDLAPQLESARRLAALAEQVRPVVLVVDDDEFQHRLLAQVLADERPELLAAASGTEALGILRKRHPDLILMDIDLPEMDGVEVTRRIKSVEQFASIPVVMITGHSDRQLVVESLKAGAADFIVKPFDKATVLAKLRKLLGRGG
jgi:CheY-like chemotaxis protein